MPGSGEIRFHDTTSGISSQTVAPAQVRDLTINATGTKLYIGASTIAASTATIALVRTADMSIEAGIGIVGPQQCFGSPGAVAFRSNDRLVSWDTDCDVLYQVDVGTHTQLAADTIETGRDSGASVISSNKMTLSAASGLAYAIKEDATLAIMNPQTKTFTSIAGTDVPFASDVIDTSVIDMLVATTP